MVRLVIVALFIVGGNACAAPSAGPPVQATPSPPPTALLAPTAPPPPSAVPTPSAAPTPSPRPALAPAIPPSPPARPNASPLPTIETSAASAGAGFLTPVELDLEFQQPVQDATQLKQLVDGVQQLDGIAAVRSDGLRIQVHYDSTRILPARIRARLIELGHAARAGTDVQNPGDAAD